MPFQHFPKEIEIFKNARISVPTTRVFGKYPRVRQICPQMEKLIFLEIWKMNWGSAKATNHCGTFIYSRPSIRFDRTYWNHTHSAPHQEEAQPLIHNQNQVREYCCLHVRQ